MLGIRKNCNISPLPSHNSFNDFIAFTKGNVALESSVEVPKVVPIFDNVIFSPLVSISVVVRILLIRLISLLL